MYSGYKSKEEQRRIIKEDIKDLKYLINKYKRKGLSATVAELKEELLRMESKKKEIK